MKVKTTTRRAIKMVGAASVTRIVDWSLISVDSFSSVFFNSSETEVFKTKLKAATIAGAPMDTKVDRLL